MKKIGHQTLFLATGEGNPRNGEGTFARLSNGDILHVYTEYYGDDWEDHAIARLAAVRSSDEGESWSDKYILMEKDADAENYMSPSLLRLPDGNLGMIFLRKSANPAGLTFDGITMVCMPMFCSSRDEGESWSEPVVCGVEDGYYCAINDGAIVQRNGRILVPMSSHKEDSACLIVAYSDDCGKSWGVLPHTFTTPFSDKGETLAEPGIYEHENRELWLWCRTLYGYQYQSRSKDNGMTWTPLEPNFYFSSPDSPMRVKRLGEYTVAIFNPIPCNCLRDDYTARGSIRRTPFVCAVSDDDGHSFNTYGSYVNGPKMIEFSKRAFLLEDSYADTYCYPSLIETKDGFLVAYYHSNGGTYTLASTKITKVLFEEISK
ncbi:MAG: exo-alpha-sialidase [Ruminococcaceae bacterium]|nr:exo-alpha-sialidase [Oscillospiraceae bacterium]